MKTPRRKAAVLAAVLAAAVPAGCRGTNTAQPGGAAASAASTVDVVADAAAVLAENSAADAADPTWDASRATTVNLATAAEDGTVGITAAGTYRLTGTLDGQVVVDAGDADVTLVLNAEGDGFDSNGTAEITGGTVVVNGPARSGNGALDVNGSFTISGGVLLAAGSAGMAVAPGTGSAQGWLSATLTSAVAAGTTVQITDAGGTVLATFVTSKTTQNVVHSGPKITSGAQYKVYTGGTATRTSTGGLARSGSLGAATLAATVTAGQAPAGNGFGGGRR
ncbi:hypothetical protein [Dactylosporangium sp. NPDC049140]|uniref:carbohydrate-binding domain-containing protein n=1 Tax=Dactylosporangium sp. NPDC049140 TaxID=3155647 RepID=UPI0033FC8FCD